MQSDVPPLPISCLTDKPCLHRTFTIKSKPTEENSKPKSTCSKTSPGVRLLTNKKRLLRPLVGNSPYKNTARCNNQVADTAKSPNNKASAIDQRVSSAKMLRIKQLQNQLADAHFHLNELSNENKLLKAIQKRQDTALKRYEGTKAELPRIINTHQEDFRVLQTKYKKLRSQYKDVSDMLKDKENELHSLQAQNKKLVQLSKDRHLLEREKLQTQVFDLNLRVDQQDEIIQTLKRKLELEKKYLKHQLHTEMVKHKETQKQLQETQLKLKSMEELAEQREKKSYYASHVFFNKEKPTITSQSLTNLNDHHARTDNMFKGPRRRRNEATKGQSLPALSGSTLLARSQSQETPQKSSILDIASNTANIFKSTEQTRYSGQSSKPQDSPKIAPASTSKPSLTDSPIKESQEEYTEFNNDDGDNDDKGHQSKSGVNQKYELPKALREEFGYQSDDDDDDDDKLRNSPVELDSEEKIYDPTSLTSKSRLLHTRLINSAVEAGTRTNAELVESSGSGKARSFSRDNIEYATRNQEEDNDDGEIKYDRDSVITVISRDALKNDLEINYSSSSDLESEMEIPIAYGLDEDENVRRKSDVIIVDDYDMDRRKNSGSTKLTENLDDSSNELFHSRKDFKATLNLDYNKANLKIGGGNKSSGKSINGILKSSERLTEDVGTSIDDLITRKKIEIKAKSPTLSLDDADEYEKAALDDFITTEVEMEKQEYDEELKENDDSILESDRSLESNVNNFNLSDKINYSSKESDLKCNTEGKTATENSKAFDKAKLLAAMKAIDDNENIEFIEQKPRKNSAANRLKITENLYRGVPTHSKKKSDIMKELFSDVQLDNKNSKENLR